MTGTRPRILCVDDEPEILESLRDTLHYGFDVRMATSGADGLMQLRDEPNAYAVILSDMRMPSMSGSVFLRESRRVVPDATRILLTGYADLDAAISAVNDGQLFRFLTKPCEPEELMRACVAAVGQHRLQTAERVLLEQTLKGSVHTLADVLAVVCPAAFGRSQRVTATVERLARAIHLNDSWEAEVSALLVHIGAVTLPETTAEKLYAGGRLNASEQAMVERIPAVTRRLLKNIPRLEGYSRFSTATSSRSLQQVRRTTCRWVRGFCGSHLTTTRSRRKVRAPAPLKKRCSAEPGCTTLSSSRCLPRRWDRVPAAGASLRSGSDTCAQEWSSPTTCTALREPSSSRAVTASQTS